MSKPLRICHLTSVHKDGDIRIFHKMAKSMAHFYEVHVVVPNTQTRIQDGVQIHSFKADTQNRRIRLKYTVDSVLQEALQIKADIYHLHDPELLRLAKRLQSTGAKVVFDSHEDVPKQIMDKHWIPKLLRRIISFVYSQYERQLTKQLDGIISVTPIICERFKRFNSKVELIQNFPLIEEFPLPDWSKKVANEFCYIGGLYESRGIREVVLSMEHLDAKLHLAGTFDDPMLKAELQKSPAWDKIIFHGQVDREKIKEILQRCTVGIVTLHPTPSYLEAYPIKMFEYMAGGCAVLASDFPLYHKLMDHYQCGQFVDPQNHLAIANSLSTNLQQPKQTLNWCENARNCFEAQYNWSTEAMKLKDFYLSI